MFAVVLDVIFWTLAIKTSPTVQFASTSVLRNHAIPLTLSRNTEPISKILITAVLPIAALWAYVGTQIFK